MTRAQSVEPRVGSPVNPLLGAKYLAGDEDRDFVVEGPLPLIWQRIYSSLNPRVGWFGRGWSSPFEDSLELVSAMGDVPPHVVYVDPFGRRIEMPTLEPGTESFIAAEQLVLFRTSAGSYCVRDRDGIVRYFGGDDGRVRRLTAIVDRNDNAIVLETESDGSALRVSCSGGQMLEFRFERGRVTAVVERRDRGAALHARYEYDHAGDLEAVFDRSDACLRRFAYSDERLMIYQRDANGFESHYTYRDVVGDVRVVRQWNNVGETWDLEYLDDRTIVRDQDERTTVFHCDERRRWIGFTDEAGRFTQRALDRQGHVRAIVTPAEQVMETVFDERGNAIQIREPDGAVTQYEWDERFPLITAITDGLNRTMRYAYDAKGNLVEEVDPAGARTVFRRDTRGLATEIVDALGGTKRLAHDERGLLIRFADCSGRVTNLDYDDDGRLVRVTDALGQSTTYEYDAAGHLVRHTLADGTFEAYENDAAGNVTAVVDALGNRTRFEYAPDGRLVTRVDPLGHTVAYSYDRARRLVALVNENAARFDMRYDVVDRLVEEHRFDGGVTRYEYDLADNLRRKVEAPESDERIETSFDHDPMGRILAKRSRHRHVEFAYDAAGQMTSAREPAVALHLAYDPAGQVVEERVITGVAAFRTRHEYDALGNRLSTVLPDGTKVGTLYYGSGHAHQIRVDDDAISDIERDALHREVGRSQGRIETTRSYDPAGRLLSKRAAIGSEAPIIERAFQYDRAGRLVVARDGRYRDLVYGYDELDRLTRFNDERFSFDPAHNLIATTVENASSGRVEGGRVVMQEDRRYRYDAHGRMIEKRSGSHTLLQLRWDDAHRLIESTRTKSGATTTTRYLYDPLGRRIAKEAVDGVVWFHWVEDQLVQQTTQGASHTFVYEPDSFTPFAVGVASVDDPAKKSIYYYHCDQIGLPRELTDADGAIRWEGRYRGWGRLREQHVDGVEVSYSQIQPLRLEGQYDDEETGLYYCRFRYYDPDIAAFVTPDPIGLDGDENLYRYAPNPVDWIDPYGLFNKRRANGQFAKKPGPKKKTDPTHGCSLATTKPAQGYELRDLDTGEVKKYGETTRGTLRYTKAYLKSENVEMVFVAKGTKKEMKDWENKKIVGYKASHGGCRPPLNKSDH